MINFFLQLGDIFFERPGHWHVQHSLIRRVEITGARGAKTTSHPDSTSTLSLLSPILDAALTRQFRRRANVSLGEDNGKCQQTDWSAGLWSHYITSSCGGNVFTWTHHSLPSQWYGSTDHRMQQGVDGFAWGTQYTKYESTTYILPQLFCTQVSKMRYWTWQQLFWFILTLAFLKLVILLAIILRYMIVGLVGWKTAYRVPTSASIYFLKERWLHQLFENIERCRVVSLHGIDGDWLEEMSSGLTFLLQK